MEIHQPGAMRSDETKNQQLFFRPRQTPRNRDAPGRLTMKSAITAGSFHSEYFLYLQENPAKLLRYGNAFVKRQLWRHKAYATERLPRFPAAGMTTHRPPENNGLFKNSIKPIRCQQANYCYHTLFIGYKHRTRIPAFPNWLCSFPLSASDTQALQPAVHCIAGSLGHGHQQATRHAQ